MNTSRIKFLDGFRLLLALWVVLAHFYTLIGGVKFIPLPKILLLSFNQPLIAVYGFMVITGFLMAYNYFTRREKEPVDVWSTFVKFWLRRIFRLYPVYILAVSFAFFTYVDIAKFNEDNLVFFTGSKLSQWGFVRSIDQPSIQDFVSHILLVHGLFPEFHDSILGVTWSLSLEMQFYFLFPFLFLLLFSTTSILQKRLAIFMFTCTLLAIISPKLFEFITKYYALPNFKLPSILIYTLPLFLLGMISAGVKLHKINSVYLVISLFLVSSLQTIPTNIVIALFLTFLFLDEMQEVVPQSIFKVLLFLRSVLSGRMSGYGADISYSLYLIHTMVIGYVLHLTTTLSANLAISKSVIALLALALTLGICFLLCSLIYVFIEKPFIEIGRKTVNKIKDKQLDAIPEQVLN